MDIVTSTAEIRALDKAQKELITYYHYIEAWVISVNNRYGAGDDGKTNFVQETESLLTSRGVQMGTPISPALMENYNRGRWTLSLMKYLPIDSYSKLTLYANLWLPVHSYYAINAIGKASMIALNMNVPRGHHPFIRAFLNLVQCYLPYPFCGLCVGGPEKWDFSFPQLNTSASEVVQQSHLANPALADGDNLIGKSLATTRKKRIDERLGNKRKKDKKPGKKWKRLTFQEKRDCCRRVAPTSICDLIYRMRCKSNYDSPDMYLSASGDVHGATNHYKNLLYLTEILIAGLETLIERRIGQTEMVALKSRFE